MKEIMHKVITLRGMRSGAGGFARFHAQGKRAGVMIHARGIGKEGFCAYWSRNGGEMAKLGTAQADARGEGMLEAELPGEWQPGGKLQALLLVENTPSPAPLLIGLMEGSMMDARNACISLCAKLNKKEGREPTPITQEKPVAKREEKQGGKDEKPPAETFVEKPAQKPVIIRPEMPIPSPWTEEKLQEGYKAQYRAEKSKELHSLMKTLSHSPAAWQAGKVETKPFQFKPAERTQATSEQAQKALPEKVRRYADDLPTLQWPPLFQPVKEIFSRSRPSGLFVSPGWRFVCASTHNDGLWIGRQETGGVVSRIAYIHGGDREEELGKSFQPIMGTDGKRYRALVQKA